MFISLNVQDICHNQLRGIGYYIVNLFNSLIKRNTYNYNLLFCDKDGERNNKRYIDKHFSNLCVPIHECRDIHYGQSIMGDLYRDKSFLDYFNLNADIVHFPFSYGIPNNVGAELITTVHDLFPVIFHDYFNDKTISEFTFSLLRMVKANTTVIADSEYTKSELCYYTPILPERVFVVPLGYNEEECYPQCDNEVLSKYAITQPYFLYFGIIDERKNVRRLIEAYNIITKKHPDCKLVIAGGSEAAFCDLNNFVQAAQEAGNVICTGYVTNDERRSLMSGAAAFVFPSLAEGFGLPVLEAMACGTPVITSNTSSLPEVAGDAAILIDPTNVEQLAYEMEHVLTSESLRKELIAKGFENCKRFSWDKTAEMTEEVYKIAYENR